MPNDPVSANFLAFAVRRMELSERDINSCLDRLTPEHIFYRGGDNENSIANLLLHLAGNLRQWVLHGIDGQPDVRTRDDEFSLMPQLPLAEIRARFAATLAECRAVIAAVPPERMLTIIDPQPNGGWGTATIVEAVFLVVGHLQLHTGQIILLTKQFTHADLDLTIPRKR
jgi:uncharacterized damage-inducible protein DinB